MAKAKPKPKTTKKNEIAIKEEAGLPALAGMEEYAGGGFENTDQDSFAIPFLSLLQSNSPQCKKSDGAYIKGAEEGLFYNTVTEEIFETVQIIPVAYKRQILEWKPRDEGGGIAGIYEPGQEPSAERDDDGKLVTDQGTILKDTRMHYCLHVLPDGSTMPVVLSLSSTQIKKSRKLMTVLTNLKMNGKKGKFTPPMFASLFKASSIAENNDSGSWMGWNFNRLGWVTNPEHFEEAKAFYELIQKDDVKVQSNTEEVF